MAILVVDDDPALCRLLKCRLHKLGCETVMREDGDAALSPLTGPDGSGIDCLVLDLVMPNLDGMGVLARLRQAAKVPVIVQTGHGGINNVVSAMRPGAVDFVVEPIGAERLQVGLRYALNTRALEGEIQRMAESRARLCRHRHPQSQFGGRHPHSGEGGGLQHSAAHCGRVPAFARN